MPNLSERVYSLESKVADMNGKRIENIETSVASVDKKVDGCVTDISYLKGKADGIWKVFAIFGTIITAIVAIVQVLIKVLAG